jgi:hypothetical protein
VVMGAADHLAASLFLQHEARTHQPAQVEGQGGGGYVEADLDISVMLSPTGLARTRRR